MAQTFDRNPQAYLPAGRIAWQVILAPWALAGLVAPFVAVFWLTEGRARDAAGLAAFAIWFLAAFMGVSWLFYARPIFHLWLARVGRQATGVIITKLEHRRFARGPKHVVRYRFNCDRGRAHSGLEGIRPEVFENLNIGDAVDIWYLHRAPFINVPAPFCEYSRRAILP